LTYVEKEKGKLMADINWNEIILPSNTTLKTDEGLMVTMMNGEKVLVPFQSVVVASGYDDTPLDQDKIDKYFDKLVKKIDKVKQEKEDKFKVDNDNKDPVDAILFVNRGFEMHENPDYSVEASGQYCFGLFGVTVYIDPSGIYDPSMWPAE
jgi:hypothetical protein